MVKANAVMVCPEGNENWSGGSKVAQQWGSRALGRFLPMSFLRTRNIPAPALQAVQAAATAAYRLAPPRIKSSALTPYHSQPSPPRVARIIHSRNQRGGRQRCTLRIRR